MCCSSWHGLPTRGTPLLLGARRGPRGAASPIPPTNRLRGTNSTCDVIYRLIFAPRATGRGLQAPVSTLVTPVRLRIWAASSSGWLAAISFNANSKRERGTMDGGRRRESDLIRSLKMEEFPATLHVVICWLFRGGLDKVRQTRQILPKIIRGGPRNLNFETLLKLLGNYYGTLRLA